MELGSTNGQLQNRQLQILRQVFFLSAIGLGLFAIVLFAPDASQAQGVFFLPALQTTWDHALDIPAVWSSVKIILFSIGLFLIIESAGTVLAVFKYKSIAVPVFFMQILPCLALLSGSYYLIKSLL
jgi:hypothetical protein